jgi:hypothetical protein
MSWETRTGRGLYYTRSRRVGGRIVREYIGRGSAADLMAELDRQERERQRAEAARMVIRKAEDAALDTQVDEVCRLADLLARGLLLAAGLHQHHGEWRKRRGEAKRKRRGKRLPSAS